MEQRNNLIEMYYTLRLTFDEIKYKVIISTRQLKRIVASLGLYRRRSRGNLFDVATFISKELKVSGQPHGYRWMHTNCLERGLEIDKESVRLIIKCLDPTGVKCRNARKLTRRAYMNNGPNYIWHMDGYDKLKPYEICIHGCIDGFSRNIMWLEADTTNKDPYVIAGYFIDTVREVGGCPRCIRADLGTENGIVRELQVALRDCDGHETNAFLYGTSKCNQRIESWWNILRKECAQFWMDMFQTIKDDGHFSGDFLDVNLIRFYFMNLVHVCFQNILLSINNF
ncbi:unnamed protein product [Mytilus coruscus]|uniref:Integrase core domain-containing protein n=1 Tax=Mytilus coruscus TaxID=42192 RepID=A0A6J8EST0_MYTCO|nr:unnamed protein product [Mytilus coruscus]